MIISCVRACCVPCGSRFWRLYCSAPYGTQSGLGCFDDDDGSSSQVLVPLEKKGTQSQPSLPNRNPKPSSGRVQIPFVYSPVTVLMPMLATGIPPAQYPNVVPLERWIPAIAAAVEVSLLESCCDFSIHFFISSDPGPSGICSATLDF